MAGLWTMIRLILRRDRVKLPLCFGGFAIVCLLLVPVMRDVYGDPDSLSSMHETLGISPAARFVVGSMDAPTLGALVTVELLLWFGVALAIINTMFVVRHTRHNEEVGAQELLLSGRAHRASGLVAAIVVAALTNVAVTVVLGAGLQMMNLPWSVSESWLFATALGAFGLVWATIAAIVVQLVENGRTANSILAGLVGIAFVMRGVGDFLAQMGDSGLYEPTWVSVFSPFGWMQATRPLTNPDWSPLLISLGFAVAATVISCVLLSCRDVGAGILPARKGRARASRLLGTPLGLVWHVQKNVFIGWLVTIVLMVATIGALVPQMASILSDSDGMRLMIQAVGGAGELVPAFIATMMAIVCLMVFSYVIHGLTKLHSEESSGHLDNLLSTKISRTKWIGLNTLVVGVGAVVMLVAIGFGLAVCVNILSKYTVNVGEYTLAALSYAPIVWAFAGLYLALYGLLPRIAGGVTWLYFGFVAFTFWLGPIIKLNESVMKLSIMDYIATPPIEDILVWPLSIMGAIATGLIIVGFVAFRRRSIKM